MEVRRVCIIGAGVSGLVALKSCLEEGLDPVCYERDENLGGLWNYRDDVVTPRGSVLYESVVTNSSKEMMCFSDFLFPEDAPPYLPARSLIKYYQDYADHFNLLPHIQFNTEVIRVVQTEDFERTGRWRVTIIQNSEETDHIFDAVMPATGFYSAPNQPTYPGEEDFEGSVFHANQYRTNEPYRGKTVVVVGGSHTAGDIAVETSVTAKQVYISLRSGTWIFSRVGQQGFPHDLFISRRLDFLKPDWYQWWSLVMKNPSLEESSLDNLGLRTKRKLPNSSRMVNDLIKSRILCGKVKTKPGIDHFTRRGLVFTDGTAVEADVVIYATGYKMRVPFMDRSIVQETLEELELFKHIFPPRLQHPTCACIGFIASFGAFGPVYEMQSRWAVRVFKGMCNLPEAAEMLDNIRHVKDSLYQRFGKHVVVVDAVPYTDDLANKIGVLPTFRGLILTDPVLAFNLLLGPIAPCTYRLVGPHRWKGARDAYLSLWERNRNATRTRTLALRETLPSYSLKYVLTILTAFVLTAVYTR